ncbi:MAG: hypothetical protein J6K04_13090 [Lachnospiraceae bacterium]|nr:hypothetical protein [Lachnospiraceae bacterium]
MNKRLAKMLIVCLLAISVLIGCGSSKLKGQWEAVTPPEYFFTEIEFFSDGTYASNQSNHNGTYSVDGDRLRISGILVEDKTFTYKVKGDTLYLEASNGVEYVFEKAD